MIDERAPGAGAVDARRLERLLRQRLQPRQQDQEHQRRPLPHVERDEAPERAALAVEDADRAAATGPETDDNSPDVGRVESRKTIPTTTGVTTIGTISISRMARMNGSSRRHSSASPRPSTVSIATAKVTNLSVVVGIVFRLIYASDVGLFSSVSGLFGGGSVGILDSESRAFWGLVLLDVWEWTPLMFLILLAGLQSLPQEPFEAARVDGAGVWRTFVDHTLPMLTPVLVVAIVLRTIDAFSTFDQVYVLTHGGPARPRS